jgi:hypothetical protein
VIKKDYLSWQFNLEHLVIRLFVILQPDTSFDRYLTATESVVMYKSVSKSKIHHLLNYVGRNKEIPRINFIFWGWPYVPPKFDIELLNLLRNAK